MSAHSVIAAVDLGSNSFRLQVARVEHGQPYTQDSLKESIRLAAGLQADKTLSEESQERALDCLARFGERLRGIPGDAIRAVGTNTLRVAKNSSRFLARAEALLGVPIEIIAGQEEARLIFTGVTHTQPRRPGRRLVVDIGGGSTELIIGRGFKPQRLESLYMGCVSYTQRFFSDGKVNLRALRNAELAAATELLAVRAQFHGANWDHAIGSSGTARALAEVLELNGFAGQGITLAGLVFLRERLLQARDVRALELAGVRPDRVPVLPGGLAIMLSVFEQLEVSQMQTTDSGLREGVLYEMLGRLEHHRDIRKTTVQAFMERYGVDPLQARRVQKRARLLLRQAASPSVVAHFGPYLDWAAGLHEIGLSIAHSGYHRHSAYIVANADMPGFSKSEQALLASLIQAQRGRLVKVAERITTPESWLLVCCLRLAVLLHRDHGDRAVPRLRLVPNLQGWDLEVAQRWLEQNPLGQANLLAELAQWQSSGRPLVLRVLP